MTSSVWYLENIDAQGIFCPDKIDNRSQDHNVFKKNDYIFKQDEASDKLYLITKGRIKIGTKNHDSRTVTKAILGIGEIFGEKAILGEEKRRDFAQAIEETELCSMSREEMKSLFIEHNKLYYYLMKLIGNRAVEMEKRLESLVFKDSRSRIIEFLLDLVEKKGQRVGYEWVVRKFITHQEIANLTATSRQTVTSVLNELKGENILTFDRKRLLIRDLEKLQKELEVIS
ncbi:MAG: CRP/FNR family cyclic AMP-dependent transcriptional regulator [Saprospiraceae bacterium]|jgi:CRP/FNR family cyclic AMP-dependent transcriptional regulator